ncbi:hypothetical protein ACPA1U_03365, partial [Ectopseudomonas hydrolytica]
MLSFLGKLRGDGAALPPLPSLRQVLLAWLGGFLAKSLLSRCSVDSEQAGEQFLYKSLKGPDYQGLS